MPGLIKVGYSDKHSEIRAKELNHTGAPHPYIVDYDIIIEDPKKIEKLVHHSLRHHKENKEWFRCSVEEAISHFKKVTEGREIIKESYKRADREEAERLYLEEKEAKKKQEEIKRLEEETRIQAETQNKKNFSDLVMRLIMGIII